MDFIPKSLLSDVKSLKKPFNKSKKSVGISTAGGEASGGAASQHPETVPRITTTAKQSDSSSREKSPVLPRDIHTVLSSATRMTKKLENIVLPNEFKSQPSILTKLQSPLQEDELDGALAESSIADKIPETRPSVKVRLFFFHNNRRYLRKLINPILKMSHQLKRNLHMQQRTSRRKTIKKS